MNKKGFINIIVVSGIIVLLVAVGYVVIVNKTSVPSLNENYGKDQSSATSQSVDLQVISPNGGEQYKLSEKVSVKIALGNDLYSRLSSKDVIQFYLLSSSGQFVGRILGVYVKNLNDAYTIQKNMPWRSYSGELQPGINNLIWDSTEILAEGGLDAVRVQIQPGKYKILVIARGPIDGEGTITAQGKIPSWIGSQFISDRHVQGENQSLLWQKQGTYDMSIIQSYLASDFADGFITFE